MQWALGFCFLILYAYMWAVYPEICLMLRPFLCLSSRKIYEKQKVFIYQIIKKSLCATAEGL